MHLTTETLNVLLDCYESCQQRDSSVPALSFSRDGLENYKRVAPLANGCYGDVFIVQSKKTARLYALKRIAKSRVLRQPHEALFRAERQCLVDCSAARFSVGLISAFQDPSFLYLVMPFCTGGDLLSLLTRREVFSESETAFYTAELILALDELHSRGYIHRDIKPENILLGVDGHILLADFGSCVKMIEPEGVTSEHPVGTPDYISPDVLNSANTGEKYGYEVDIWAAGVVLYEMVNGVPPFYRNKLQETYRAIQKIEYENITGSSEIRALIAAMVCDRKMRWNSQKIIAYLKEHFKIDTGRLVPPIKPELDWNVNFNDLGFSDDEIPTECGYNGFIGFSYDTNVQINSEMGQKIETTDTVHVLVPQKEYDQIFGALNQLPASNFRKRGVPGIKKSISVSGNVINEIPSENLHTETSIRVSSFHLGSNEDQSLSKADVGFQVTKIQQSSLSNTAHIQSQEKYTQPEPFQEQKNLHSEGSLDSTQKMIQIAHESSELINSVNPLENSTIENQIHENFNSEANIMHKIKSQDLDTTDQESSQVNIPLTELDHKNQDLVNLKKNSSTVTLDLEERIEIVTVSRDSKSTQSLQIFDSENLITSQKETRISAEAIKDQEKDTAQQILSDLQNLHLTDEVIVCSAISENKTSETHEKLHDSTDKTNLIDRNCTLLHNALHPTPEIIRSNMGSTGESHLKKEISSQNNSSVFHTQCEPQNKGTCDLEVAPINSISRSDQIISANYQVDPNINSVCSTYPQKSQYRFYTQEIFSRIQMYLETISNQKDLLYSLTEQLYRENKLLKREIRKKESQIDVSNLKFMDELKKELKIAKNEIKEIHQRLDSEIFLKEKLQDEIKYLSEKLKSSSYSKKIRNITLQVNILTFSKDSRNYSSKQVNFELTTNSCVLDEQNIPISNIFIRNLKENELHFVSEKIRRLLVKIVILNQKIRKPTNHSSNKSEEELSAEILKENKIIEGIENMMKAVPTDSDIYRKAILQRNGSIKRIQQLEKEIDYKKSQMSLSSPQSIGKSSLMSNLGNKSFQPLVNDSERSISIDSRKNCEQTADGSSPFGATKMEQDSTQKTDREVKNNTNHIKIVTPCTANISDPRLNVIDVNKDATCFRDFLQRSQSKPFDHSINCEGFIKCPDDLKENPFKIPKNMHQNDVEYFAQNIRANQNAYFKNKKSAHTHDKSFDFNNHTFFFKTFLTDQSCSNCEQILYGSKNQGLMCSECKMVVHQSCYVLVEESCEMYKASQDGKVFYVMLRSIEDKTRLLAAFN